MASAEDIRELQKKLDALIARRFGVGAWGAAFSAYDADADGRIDAGELKALLRDAGVGNFLTIGAWVDGVLSEVDADHDGGIALPELERVLGQRRTPAAAAQSKPAPAAAAQPKPAPAARAAAGFGAILILAGALLLTRLRAAMPPSRCTQSSTCPACFITWSSAASNPMACESSSWKGSG